MKVAATAILLALALTLTAPAQSSTQATYRIDHVTDGDTVVLRNGQRVRLVQIDTPEVFFGTECYGPQASATTKRLLPAGTQVGFMVEPATDRVDEFGRLLRYVVRVNDGVNVNLRLVAVGAAAPYFFDGRRGRYAARLEALASARRRSGSGFGVRAHELSTTRTGASTPAAKRTRPKERLGELAQARHALSGPGAIGEIRGVAEFEMPPGPTRRCSDRARPRRAQCVVRTRRGHRLVGRLRFLSATSTPVPLLHLVASAVSLKVVARLGPRRLCMVAVRVNSQFGVSSRTGLSRGCTPS